jgi:hypothetical protein
LVSCFGLSSLPYPGSAVQPDLCGQPVPAVKLDVTSQAK